MINDVQMPLNKIDKQRNPPSIWPLKERGEVEKGVGATPPYQHSFCNGYLVHNIGNSYNKDLFRKNGGFEHLRFTAAVSSI